MPAKPVKVPPPHKGKVNKKPPETITELKDAGHRPSLRLTEILCLVEKKPEITLPEIAKELERDMWEVEEICRNFDFEPKQYAKMKETRVINIEYAIGVLQKKLIQNLHSDKPASYYKDLVPMHTQLIETLRKLNGEYDQKIQVDNNWNWQQLTQRLDKENMLGKSIMLEPNEDGIFTETPTKN